MACTSALLLADGRFPAGGHAHSGGVEAAVAAGLVGDLPGLERFLLGRLRTAGLVAAGLAHLACAWVLQERGDWATLNAEADARIPSPAQRDVSRRQGRALLRAARVAWPTARSLVSLSDAAALPRPEAQANSAPRPGAQANSAPRPEAQANSAPRPEAQANSAPHHPIVLGAAAAAAGCSPREAALVAAYQSVTGPASAAVRLLSFDPLEVNGLLARLAAEVDLVAQRAATSDELPFPSAPALDLLAEAHARTEVKLFAS